MQLFKAPYINPSTNLKHEKLNICTVKQKTSPTATKADRSPAQTANPPSPGVVFSRQLIIKGSLWFALITIVTVAGIFFYHNTGKTIGALRHISYPYIGLCLIMLCADLMLGSWRNHIYVQKLAPAVPHWVSFKANVANMFMGAVTPAHGGAGPAQIYVYTSNGVKFVDAFAISLINMGATLIFMPLAGFAAIMLMDTSAVSGLVPAMLQYGFCFFLVFLLAFLLAFWKPVWMGIAIRQIANVLLAIVPKHQSKLDAWAINACQSINNYQQTCSIILKKNRCCFRLVCLLLRCCILTNTVCSTSSCWVWACRPV